MPEFRPSKKERLAFISDVDAMFSTKLAQPFVGNAVNYPDLVATQPIPVPFEGGFCYDPSLVSLPTFHIQMNQHLGQAVSFHHGMGEDGFNEFVGRVLPRNDEAKNSAVGSFLVGSKGGMNPITLKELLDFLQDSSSFELHHDKLRTKANGLPAASRPVIADTPFAVEKPSNIAPVHRT